MDLIVKQAGGVALFGHSPSIWIGSFLLFLLIRGLWRSFLFSGNHTSERMSKDQKLLYHSLNPHTSRRRSPLKVKAERITVITEEDSLALREEELLQEYEKTFSTFPRKSGKR